MTAQRVSVGSPTGGRGPSSLASGAMTGTKARLGRAASESAEPPIVAAPAVTAVAHEGAGAAAHGVQERLGDRVAAVVVERVRAAAVREDHGIRGRVRRGGGDLRSEPRAVVGAGVAQDPDAVRASVEG